MEMSKTWLVEQNKKIQTKRIAISVLLHIVTINKRSINGQIFFRAGPETGSNLFICMSATYRIELKKPERPFRNFIGSFSSHAPRSRSSRHTHEPQI